MVQVRQSTIIDAPVDEVWRILRDFNGHDRWHPAVGRSEIDHGDPVDAIGAIRHFWLADGSELREQLLSLSDADRSFTYCLLEAPIPLMDYVATVRLRPVTDGSRTFWEWSSRFNPPASRREELVGLVTRDIYQAGFVAIKRRFGRTAPAPRAPALPAGRPQRFDPEPAIARPVPAQTGSVPTRAIVVERYGGPEVLRLQAIDLPPPAPGEVRLRHTVIGVNFIDIYCRTGYFDLLKPPGIPGMEAAGLIEAVGPGVEGFAVGDRVAYACPPVGAYCERRNMAPDLLVHLSDDIPDEIAAAGLLKGVTASLLLHDVHRLVPGSVVLIHAAAGGVGQLLVQWARHLGATVIATVSTADKARIAERHGAHHVILYSQEDFAAAVMRITEGRGADVVFDAVGNDTFGASLAALAIRGHLVSFGQASGPVGDWDIGRFASKSLTVSRPNYGHYTDTPERLRPHVERFFRALREGIVRVDAPTRFSLSEAAEAHRLLETRQTTGSLVLVV
ncbi:zinc-binding dehydrogenase [Labrys monachus]|uniref:NADPH:quinone reductase-like Zn-dependent oxidoreductase n=1 Tax=Labrys monachus TaxID=217067 RepID=A0ABU0FA80_9HYPH|nr:zinc-binding dehydrogenase [Labrys monachus]MDQ0390960.1 NADPH:quinone reductase-like Zn-dependent oxidoreductase [Labrys monachus]